MKKLPSTVTMEEWETLCDKSHRTNLAKIKVNPNKLINVKIYLEDDIFLKLAKLAHERDITFNQLVNIYLKEYIDNENNNRR